MTVFQVAPVTFRTTKHPMLLCFLILVTSSTALQAPTLPMLMQPPPTHGKPLAFDPSLPTDEKHSLARPDSETAAAATTTTDGDSDSNIAAHLDERRRLFSSDSNSDSDSDSDSDSEHYPRRYLSTPDSCSTTPTTVAIGQEITLGGAASSYANSQSCVWNVQGGLAAGSTSIGVAFTFFHTEENEDTLKVYDADHPTVLLGKAHSGDELTPFVISFDGVSRLKIVFTSNEGSAESSRTLQLGFKGKVFDAGTNCHAGETCSGHGTCSPLQAGKARKCNCDQLSSDSIMSDVYFDDDCSTIVRYIAPDTPFTIANLPIGAWSYVWTPVERNKKYLIDFRDTGAPNSDPLLILGSASTMEPGGAWHPSLPRLNGKYFEDYLR